MNCSQNLINIDTVAKAIIVLVEHDNEVFHVVSPSSIDSRHFFNLVSEFFNFQLPEFIPLSEFDFQKLTPSQRALAEPFSPYFNFRGQFIALKTSSFLEKEDCQLPAVSDDNLIAIFRYCMKSKFI